MKARKASLIAAGCLALMQVAPADTIVLKSGEKLSGNILREDADSYVLEVRVTGTIRDEKIIPRSEVSFVEMQPADEKAFEKIEVLSPAPELLGTDGYDARIKAFNDFLAEFPKSGKTIKVRDIIGALEAERVIVAAGGMKIGEEMVSAEDYVANAYEYDAQISEKKIRDAVARRDFLSALREFSEYETRFGDTEAYRGLASLVLKVLNVYLSDLEDSLSTLESRLAKRQAGLERMAVDDRAKTKRALEEQMATLTKRYEDEKAAGEKWITPDTFHKESLDEAQRQVAAELSRLTSAQPPVPLEYPLAEVFRDCWAKVADGSDEEKKAVIEDAKAKGLPEFYVAKLRELAGIVQN